MLKRELYKRQMHLTFIPLRSIKAGDFDVMRQLHHDQDTKTKRESVKKSKQGSESLADCSWIRWVPRRGVHSSIGTLLN